MEKSEEPSSGRSKRNVEKTNSHAIDLPSPNPTTFPNNPTHTPQPLRANTNDDTSWSAIFASILWLVVRKAIYFVLCKIAKGLYRKLRRRLRRRRQGAEGLMERIWKYGRVGLWWREEVACCVWVGTRRVEGLCTGWLSID